MVSSGLGRGVFENPKARRRAKNRRRTAGSLDRGQVCGNRGEIIFTANAALVLDAVEELRGVDCYFYGVIGVNNRSLYLCCAV